MLIDFSDVKTILMEHIHDVVDHAFLVYEGDIEVLKSLSQLEDQKIVSLPFIPTAENLAKWAYYIVEPHLKTTYGNDLRLRSFNVRETPKSWASYEPSDRESQPKLCCSFDKGIFHWISCFDWLKIHRIDISMSI